MAARLQQGATQEFGHRLRALRRHAGLTQAQLGRQVGYHASLISKLESGERPPSAVLLRRLDDLLDAGGRLTETLAARNTPGAPAAPHGVGALLFSVPPLPDAPPVKVSDILQRWPVSLPHSGVTCPLHCADACAVPPPWYALSAVTAIRAHRDKATEYAANPDVAHGFAALLASLAESAALAVTPPMLHAVEHVLRTVVAWSQDVYGSSGPVQAPLALASGYAQLAGRLRMLLGYNALAMSWLEHSLTWAGAVDDTVTSASVYTDLCTLIRLDHDGASSLAYARALGGLDPGRHWVSTLSHAYAARAQAFTGDVRAVDHEITAARRRLGRMDERDLVEAPWMLGEDGTLRVESAAAGALRDVAVLTGDRAAARRAVHATRRSLSLVPARMRPTRLLLTTRLADSHVCAGEPEAAVPLMDQVLEASSTSRSTLLLEIAGLRQHLRPWLALPEVHDLHERLQAAAS